jgi:16S rRNA C967 or C1407 C5-methylase (RsmB/RsmF family)
MIRGGTTGAIVRLGAPRPPSEPHPKVEEAAAPGPLRRAATGKGDRRSLNSKRRRFLDDVDHAVVRHRRTLDLLRERAGLPPGVSDAGLRLATWLGALILHAGLPPSSAAAAWGRDPLDWDAFADPAHTLTGWVLETSPSAAEALGVACSLPDAFARRLLADHAGGIGAGRVLATDREALDLLGELADPVLLARSLNSRAPLTLRVNRLRADRPAVLEALAEDGIAARASRWTDGGVIVDGSPNVQGSRALSQGLAEVQDEGSALIVELLGVQPGETIVDACAGAGGKALAIASRLGGFGTIVAADTRPAALAELARRARRAGAEIATSPISAEGRLPKRLASLVGRADRVLLDVPCSSSGALRRRPRVRWSIDDSEVARLARLQGRILRRFAPLVRPGGTLVYATCSLFDEENDDVVRAFLASSAGAAFRVVPAGPRMVQAASLGVTDALRLLPHRHGTDGFYGVALERESGRPLRG